MPERTNRILELLATKQRAEVSWLSDELGISQVTVRKDLTELERRGLIEREHGYAMLKSQNDVEGRLAYHYEAKLEIAQRAAAFVRDGETVMIENGSCCALLAAQIAATRRDVTIITNSAFIAAYVRGALDGQIILVGGIYQKDAQVCVGPLVRQNVSGFFVERLFVGADGFSEQTGFTNSDLMRAQAVHDMAEQAEQVVVLTESEKFSQRGTVPLDFAGRPVNVVTDENVPAAARASLATAGISLID